MLAVLFGVFAALCWSVHDVIARSIAGAVGGFRVAAWVMVTGFLLLTGYILYDGTVWGASREAVMSGFALGFAYGFGVGGLFKAFSLGPVSLVGPVTAGYPVLAVLWNVAFNHVFERWESRQRVRGRSLARRVAHAIGFEGGLALILVPLLAWWFGVGLWQALVMDFGLMVFFLLYTFVFNWCFDRVFGLPAAAL